MSIVPPASATLIWALPTKFGEIRCLVWEDEPAGWVIAIVFGNETLAHHKARTGPAMEAAVDLLWHGLLNAGWPHTPSRHPEPSPQASRETESSYDTEAPYVPPRRRPH
jgi:hypothetical protein